MGFYGNISNTSQTQFQFDRIYSNRYEMGKNKTKDGIFVGRYVLIEYDEPYGTNIDTDNTYIPFTFDAETIPEDNFYIGNVPYSEANNGMIFLNEQCFFVPESNYKGKTKFKKITKEDSQSYAQNYNIDTAIYESSRGYDSTVWQKVFSDSQEKYVMIAELNSVVPTLDLSVDAPTPTPMLPHFDTDSTSVYYKIHLQPSWGMQVAEAKDTPSDERIIQQKVIYNSDTDKFEVTSSNVPGAIYFNRAGFNPKVAHKVDSPDSITVMPTGVSGNLYNKHKGMEGTETKPDIYELRINLPSIGNAISDVWDVVHGPDRKDGVNSLIGQLKAYEMMPEYSIPIIKNRQAVGSTLEGDSWITPTVETQTNTISFAHTQTFENDQSLKGPSFNTSLDFDTANSFTVPSLSCDSAGHITQLDNRKITLPALDLTKQKQDSPDSVVTSLSFDKSKSVLIEDDHNIGELVLSSYVEDISSTSPKTLSSTDTINEAFASLQKQILLDKTIIQKMSQQIQTLSTQVAALTITTP